MPFAPAVRVAARVVARVVAVLAAALVLGTALAAPAHADPLRLSVTAQVNAPGKPSLTLVADEPLTGLSVALEPEAGDPGEASKSVPSGETAAVKVTQKKVAPGQKVVVTLGTGRVGLTHWHGVITCQAGGKLWKREASLDTDVRKGLGIKYDSNYYSPHLNVDQRYVEVQLSEPASKAEIEVYADDGTKVGSGHASFSSTTPDTWLRIPWRGEGAPSADAVVLRLAIKVYDQRDNWASIDLYPWKVEVPHEDIRFDTASSEIPEGERAKLDESLSKINAVLDRVERTLMRFAEKGILTGPPPRPQLFIAGHTDTVGGDADNLALSRNRARAIAAYFRQHGFRAPASFVGCGERQPRVRTADNVDEARNRRADYTLALQPPPVLQGLSWQTVK
ncbi:MAG: OmpA family protein [Polyangia bacterium]